MKRSGIFILLILGVSSGKMLSQEAETKISENYGGVLNVGVGLGYYNYVGSTMPVIHADYEVQLMDNLTVAPSISVYQYSGQHLWVNSEGAYRNYSYDETVIPLGLKVSCYFDELLHAGPKWDFYSSGSLGLIVRKTSWEKAYSGPKDIQPGTGPLCLDFHIGTEFHMTGLLGLQLDLSTGVSTLGLCFHM